MYIDDSCNPRGLICRNPNSTMMTTFDDMTHFDAPEPRGGWIATGASR